MVERERGDVQRAPRRDIESRTLFHGGVLSALGNRDYALLLLGALLSNTGTWIHNTVLFWYVKDTTKSDAWVGALNLANFLPVMLLVLLAGSLADRLNRKTLIVATQAVMMLSALALGICVQAGVANLAVIMVTTAAMGIAFTFTFPATRALVTDLVPPRDLHNAVALDAAQFNLTRFIGPVLAIAVYAALSIEAAFYINAASFLAVIASLLLIKTKTPGSAFPSGGMSGHMVEGARHILGSRWSRNLLLVLGLVSFFGVSMLVLLPGLALDVLARGQFGYGLLLGCFGLGAVIGAPLVTILARALEERDIVRYSALGLGLLMLALSACRTLWACSLITVGCGVAVLMLSSTINAVLQSRVEREMRGRVMSFYILVFQGMYPLGGMMMGLLSDRTSAPLAIRIGGAAVTALGAALLLLPSFLREAPREKRREGPA